MRNIGICLLLLVFIGSPGFPANGNADAGTAGTGTAKATILPPGFGSGAGPAVSTAAFAEDAGGTGPGRRAALVAGNDALLRVDGSNAGAGAGYPTGTSGRSGYPAADFAAASGESAVAPATRATGASQARFVTAAAEESNERSTEPDSGESGQSSESTSEGTAAQGDETNEIRQMIDKADRLYHRSGLENYRKAAKLLEKVLEKDPDNFEAAWKCAQAHRQYAKTANVRKVENREEICRKHGRAGMECASLAQKLRPDSPAGYFFYGLNVGVYYKGVGIWTAINEGLMTKTRENFEKAYELDRSFMGGVPIVALARFWAELPWPMRKPEKALDLCREYQNSTFFDQREDAPLLLAECLLEVDKEKLKQEAKKFLRKAAETGDEETRKDAERLLKKLD
jgi:tetratricopeptide (TPR) repeat protein